MKRLLLLLLLPLVSCTPTVEGRQTPRFSEFRREKVGEVYVSLIRDNIYGSCTVIVFEHSGGMTLVEKGVACQ